MAVWPREFGAQPVPSRARFWIGGLVTALAIPAAMVAAGLVWLPHSIRYESDGIALTIAARIGPFGSTRRLPLERVRAARPIVPRGGYRVAGTAMPGYCTGHFRFEGLGSVTVAGNCATRAVLIVVEGESRPFLLTPPDPAAFVTALASRRPFRLEPPPVRPGPWWPWLRVLVLLIVPASLAAPLVCLLSFDRLRYAVVPGALLVRTLLAEKRVPLAGATARAHRPERLRRVAGTALPGYCTGLFRARGGGMRVYASRTTEGILVDGPTRVFVTPADPEGFLEALRAAGARVDAAS